ncbi:hypothetical protein LguiB_013136 [Lonicera macranthoides]
MGIPRVSLRANSLIASGRLNSVTRRGWEKCWDEGVTPWDLGQPTPIIVHLHRIGALPRGRDLVPGCGSSFSLVHLEQSFHVWEGHDVVAIACPERYVVGLDISDSAIKTAIELSSSSPNADYLTFLKTDFFNWHPSELFDLIFDYMFFWAIEPDMRSAWASRIQRSFKASYEEVLQLIGFKAISIVENELAIGPRKLNHQETEFLPEVRPKMECSGVEMWLVDAYRARYVKWHCLLKEIAYEGCFEHGGFLVEEGGIIMGVGLDFVEAKKGPQPQDIYPHGFVSGSSRPASQGVTHPGIALVQARLTSEFSWDPKPVSLPKGLVLN